jgi:hypothetical protein
MNKYTYWSNEKGWHSSLLAEIDAKNISEADEIFQTQTGIDPRKVPSVGVAISDTKEQ